MQGSVLFIGLYMFMHEKGQTTLSETDFCKIMEFLADYLKMIKLYEKIMCDFHFFYEKAKKHSANLWLHMVLNDEDFERVAKE